MSCIKFKENSATPCARPNLGLYTYMQYAFFNAKCDLIPAHNQLSWVQLYTVCMYTWCICNYINPTIGNVASHIAIMQLLWLLFTIVLQLHTHPCYALRTDDKWCKRSKYDPWQNSGHLIAACNCNWCQGSRCFGRDKPHYSCDLTSYCATKNRFCCRSDVSLLKIDNEIGLFSNYRSCEPAWCNHFKHYRYPAYQSKTDGSFFNQLHQSHYDKKGNVRMFHVCFMCVHNSWLSTFPVHHSSVLLNTSALWLYSHGNRKSLYSSTWKWIKSNTIFKCWSS